MLTTYSARITPKLIEGCTFFSVELLSHSEDGQQTDGVVPMVNELKTAETIVTLWRDSQSRPAVFALFSTEMPGYGDDYPDPTDVEEMKYC